MIEIDVGNVKKVFEATGAGVTLWYLNEKKMSQNF